MNGRTLDEIRVIVRALDTTCVLLALVCNSNGTLFTAFVENRRKEVGVKSTRTSFGCKSARF